MSRHRKVKAIDYDEEYDDLYGDYDVEDDFDDGAFEAKYLSSGIDLHETSRASNNQNADRQAIIDEVASMLEAPRPESEVLTKAPNLVKIPSQSPKSPALDAEQPTLNLSLDKEDSMSSITSDLARIAIQHLDKHQWQLPLMEMDKRFRDKTYYKHYTDTYISSLESKLGGFLTDNQLIENPMKYHLQEELDNYSRYSRIFELLKEYYRSSGSGYFSFTTPSPDEEIVIGCRMGTKVKKQTPKKATVTKASDTQKVARFEYGGKTSSRTPSTSKAKPNNGPETKSAAGPKSKSRDLTIQEHFTADQLDKLSKEYKQSLKLEPSKDEKTKLKTEIKVETKNKDVNQNPGAATKVSKPKQLETLTEKRQNLKQKLKRNAEITEQDRETFKKQAIQTMKEYESHLGESRPRVNLVVVGHVDAGKSTLVGHLLYKLGQINKKEMHRLEVDSQRSGKGSFKFAWAMDETADERARGVTIDIALTKFQTPSRDIVLLDAPGHVDFIPAVISGAAQADAALLVVDATRGEFETGFATGGQTREHTFLVRSLGVKSLIVVVNKMDNVNWDWLRFNDILDQLKPFLKQVGFSRSDELQFVACSGISGDNLIERRFGGKSQKQSSHPQLDGDLSNWKSMPSLLEAIDLIKAPARAVDKPTRISVTDVYKGMSSGVFLGAKVISGKLEPKQRLLLLPPNEPCEIKQLEIRDSKSDRAFAGDIVSTVATGVDLNKYYRGCILCDPLIPCQVTNRFEARIVMFQNADSIMLKGMPIELHINGTFESGEVRRLVSLINKTTGELIQNRPRCVVKNASAIIQVRLSRVVCCELYEDNKDLGRFMIRSYGKTIAAGLITKIKRAKIKERNKSKMKSK